MTDLLILLAVFGGSVVLGYVLISAVPTLLHTPLMSMTNAISAVTILGGVLLFVPGTGAVEMVVGGAALVMASFNVIGGFAISDRMLALFKKR